MAAVSAGPKAPRWNSTASIGVASRASATAAGNVSSSASSIPRFWVVDGVGGVPEPDLARQ